MVESTYRSIAGPTLTRETNDNLGGATYTHEVGGSRTDVGLSSSVDDGLTLTDDAGDAGEEGEAR